MESDHTLTPLVTPSLALILPSSSDHALNERSNPIIICGAFNSELLCAGVLATVALHFPEGS